MLNVFSFQIILFFPFAFIRVYSRLTLFPLPAMVFMLGAGFGSSSDKQFVR
jgi:hypothetical protein